MVDLYAGQLKPPNLYAPGMGQGTSYNMMLGGGAGGGTAAGDASNIRGLAGDMAGQFKGNLGYADQALKDAFDPQQANFKQQMADLTDQTRAGLSARGIGMSPYGAGVEGNTQGRFRNDWQDRQIGREAQGASTATGLQAQYQSGQHEAAGMYAQAAGISQGDVALQLQKYGLDINASRQAADMMMKLMMQREQNAWQTGETERGRVWGAGHGYGGRSI